MSMTNTVAGSATKTFDSTVNGLKSSVATATHDVEQALQKSAMPAMKTAERAMSLGSANLEACVKSGQILAAGMQELSQQIGANMQTMLHESVAAFRAMAGVKSVAEAMELRTSLVRSAVEKSMSEANRLSATMLRLNEQASAPLTARLTAAVETFSPRS